MQADVLLQKYGEIIAEEVNVKEVTFLDEKVTVTVTYIPLGQKIGALFGKDTSNVIAAAKAWHAVMQHDGTLHVSSGENVWILASDMYEVRYSGLQEDYQTIEGWVIVSLDFTITEALKKEWVAREISRFLNQMRKDAQFQIDEKLTCIYTTTHDDMHQLLEEFSEMLKDEALITDFTRVASVDTHISSVFTSEEGSIDFVLSR